MAGQKQGTMIQEQILNLLNSDDLNNGLLGWQMLEIFQPEIAMKIYRQYEKYLRCSNQYGIDRYKLRAIALSKCWCMACPLVCEIIIERVMFDIAPITFPKSHGFYLDGIFTFFANKA